MLNVTIKPKIVTIIFLFIRGYKIKSRYKLNL